MNYRIISKFLTGIFALSFSINMYADVKLPHVIGSNMVLQRNAKVPIWGWADKGEAVKVIFNGKKYAATPSTGGKWMVYLDPMPAGGPFEMKISGKNQIILNNILIGEVWICSGQSNMEFSVNMVKNAEFEVANANYPKIRLYTVPKKISAKPKPDSEGGEWLECSSQSIKRFSAVGYFFGLDLHKELNVPIGLINTCWGGTVSETWTSREAISTIPDFQNALKDMDKVDLDKMNAEMDKLKKEQASKIENDDLGRKENWQNANFNDNSWSNMKLPTIWENAGLKNVDGVVWFRKEITLDEDEVAAGITVSLGPIDDSDESFINGTKIGETWDQYNVNRLYKIAPANLKAGKNVLAVRVIDIGGDGGIWGEAALLNYTSTKGVISLAGDWKYKLGINTSSTLTSQMGPNAFPTLLFNGMIAPILPYAAQGAIWYQGESNASRAKQYETIFPLLINDWRKQWGDPVMSFLFVQLANFMEARPEPSNSEWAELRDAQLKTLALSKTGMAVIIDIGEAANIHPTNKQDVGYRLSLAARKVTYNQDIVFSGPQYESSKIEGNKIILSFNNVGSGLEVKDKYGYVKGFAIAGPDQKFVWAKAMVENNKIIVWNDNIKDPVAVRYAWADNPYDANLYNKEGLPASPFRTDNWQEITDSKK